jgi:hypothetical protein
MKKSRLFRNHKNKVLPKQKGLEYLFNFSWQNASNDWKSIQVLLRGLQEHDLGQETVEDHSDQTIHYVRHSPDFLFS